MSKPTQHSKKPGEKKTWKADRKIVMHVGDGALVDVSFNGRTLGPVGQPGARVLAQVDLLERDQVRPFRGQPTPLLANGAAHWRGVGGRGPWPAA